MHETKLSQCKLIELNKVYYQINQVMFYTSVLLPRFYLYLIKTEKGLKFHNSN